MDKKFHKDTDWESADEKVEFYFCKNKDGNYVKQRIYQ
jgi:hypothetical protein